MEDNSLTIVEENQPTLYEDIHVFFDDPDAERTEWQDAKRVQKGHGRLETRAIWPSTRMNEWFQKDWTGLAQICAPPTRGESSRKRTRRSGV